MTFCAELQGRFLLVTDGFAIGAAGMKTTARRWMDRAWDVTLKNSPLFFAARIGDGNRRQQSPCVGMLRVPVNRIALGNLDDLAEVHDRHSMADVLDYPQVMGDKNVGQVHFLLQFLQEIDDLCLN